MKKLSLLLITAFVLATSGCASKVIEDERYKAHKKQQQIEAADRANRELK